MLLTGMEGVAKLACVDLQRVEEVTGSKGRDSRRASMRQPGGRPAFRMSGGVGLQTLRPSRLHDVTSSHALTPGNGDGATHGDVLAVSDRVDVRGDVAGETDLDTHGGRGGLWCVPGTPAMSSERWTVYWMVGQGKSPLASVWARSRWSGAHALSRRAEGW